MSNGWIRYVPGETKVVATTRYALVGPGGGGAVLGLYVANRQPRWIYPLPPLPEPIDDEIQALRDTP